MDSIDQNLSHKGQEGILSHSEARSQTGRRVVSKSGSRRAASAWHSLFHY